MTSTPSPHAATVPGFVVLDLDLPDRPPLAKVGDYEAGLLALAEVQEEFYDQLDANGEGGGRVRLALTLAPTDVTGTVGPPGYWALITGRRPAQR